MCDCERPSCSVETLRTARAPHKCCECRAAIYPGETYEYVSGIWDGAPSSYHTCMPCAELRAGVVRSLERYDCGPCFGGLHGYIRDYEWEEASDAGSGH